MAGHSQFKNIMHRKGAQDKKRAKIFNKHSREIMVAAKSGMPDPDANPRLRLAIQTARGSNMPKERIDRAIKAATQSTEGDNFVEMRYEGYGPSGVAVIVEALTDNRNRTAAEVRTAFSKNGGSMGEANSVAFMFNNAGVITYDKSKADFDTLFEKAIDHGAEDVIDLDGTAEVITAREDFSSVRDGLEKDLGEPQSAGLSWLPENTIAVDEEAAMTLFKMIEALEDNDDVQNVFTNVEVSDDIMAKLAEAE